ncbi:hypothetical protein CAPTEDRAFT_132371, partial [Capitella teleta]
KDEIIAYQREPAPASTTDPLKWCSVNSHRHPLLSHAARRYLATRPKSVDSERLFSIPGNIYSDRRSRMTHDKL